MSDQKRSIDCAEALGTLYEYLDGELTPELTEAIREHLALCAECLPRFDFQRTFLDFLRARARSQGAPPELRRRIFEEVLGTAPPPDPR